VYPALAVLEALDADHDDLQVLWVGGEGGMEADLVAQAAIPFETIPAAGVHGVGLRALPGNLLRLLRGFFASRGILRRFNPDVMFFTGGYVAPPMALAGLRTPSVLYVPDIEPGLALKTLARFADRIAVTVEDSRSFFPGHKGVVVTGYPTRRELLSWDRQQAQKALNLQSDLPTLLVFGGSKGARSINRALFPALPELLAEMQIVHITGKLNWSEVDQIRKELSSAQDERYHPYPYLDEEMGAAFKAADLVLSRAGASSLGEFPLFELPAILVPYPYAWRYQRINAEFLADQGAAIIVKDEDLPERIVSQVFDLMRDTNRLTEMRSAMQSLSKPDAASSIGNELLNLAQAHVALGSEQC